MVKVSKNQHECSQVSNEVTAGLIALLVSAYVERQAPFPYSLFLYENVALSNGPQNA